MTKQHNLEQGLANYDVLAKSSPYLFFWTSLLEWSHRFIHEVSVAALTLWWQSWAVAAEMCGL